ncbi:MAG: proteasome accessory factor PafA2 family protein [Gemmatimonadales bacterium]
MNGHRHRIRKICGADIELGNFIVGSEQGGRGADAASALLAALHDQAGAVSDWRSAATDADGGPRNRRDWRRSHFPTNGACAYIDLEHLELCLPELGSAWDHVAAWHGMLRQVQRALATVNAARAPEDRIRVTVNNGDGLGNSWGSHLDFLVTREVFNDIVHRRPHYLGWLAAFQISALVYTGQGRVGSHLDPTIGYQIGQRADFLETMIAPQTTFRRPVVNTRDEALSGRSALGPDGVPLARLHVICFDSALAQVSCLLRVGPMQLALAMLEAGAINPERCLDDPLGAVRRWSHDPTLAAQATTIGGTSLSAVDLQRRFFEDATRFVEAGGAEGQVPHADRILAIWGETLDLLARRDWPALASRLDWVLKLTLLERTRQRAGLDDWSAPVLKHLDHLYGELDPETGLFWAIAERGGLDRVVTEREIERLTTEPPPDTRAYGRAMLLRHVPADTIDSVDWDTLRFHLRRRHRVERWKLDLGSPLDLTRDALSGRLTGPIDGDRLEALLLSLGGEPDPWRVSSAGAIAVRVTTGDDPYAGYTATT